jgi:hypothetical protein
VVEFGKSARRGGSAKGMRGYEANVINLFFSQMRHGDKAFATFPVKLKAEQTQKNAGGGVFRRWENGGNSTLLKCFSCYFQQFLKPEA